MSHDDPPTEPLPTDSGCDSAAAEAVSGEPSTPLSYPVAFARAVVTAWDDSLTDWAAALTYYTVLALFPMLLVVISVFGLSQPGATPEVIDHVSAVVPAQSRQLIRDALQAMTQQRSDAWLLTGFGVAGALWSGSSYLSVFRRAIYAIYRTDSRRPVWKTAPRIVVTAAVVVTAMVGSAFALVVTGTVAAQVGRVLRLGEVSRAVWDGLRWPVLLVLGVALVLVLYREGPAPTRPVRRMAPGGVLAVLVTLACSAGFTVYAAHAATYHRLYGSLAGLVIFLVWVWLSNLALVLGIQFNAELAATRPADPVADPPTSPRAAPGGTSRTGKDPESDTRA
ncbi:YihY/virulence factor BrkB family protein [Nocardia sp. NPDC051570]|uniref:YihY/virulence factor BrkB family protein n=1 Tax=Nocardia sp. NPDC051570 TaxID=3364324 RepID=UPI0037AC38E6